MVTEKDLKKFIFNFEKKKNTRIARINFLTKQLDEAIVKDDRDLINILQTEINAEQFRLEKVKVTLSFANYALLYEPKEEASEPEEVK